MGLQNLISNRKDEQVEEHVLSKASIAKILRTLSHQEAFYFCTEVGKSTGYAAYSLLDFCNKLRVVDVKSLSFHAKRGDFDRWIRLTLDDPEFASKIGTISGYEGNLRNEMYRMVYNRLKELREMQTQSHA
jgi:hypothetical protein